MNNNLNQNLNQKAIEWTNIQHDMKLKFGKDIYDSWLKKIDFVEEFKNYVLIFFGILKCKRMQNLFDFI